MLGDRGASPSGSSGDGIGFLLPGGSPGDLPVSDDLIDLVSVAPASVPYRGPSRASILAFLEPRFFEGDAVRGLLFAIVIDVSRT